MVRVLFFGRLRDLAGSAEIEIAGDCRTLGELRTMLASDNPALGLALEHASTRVAVDHAFVERDAPIAEAREIAFMPPLSGG